MNGEPPVPPDADLRPMPYLPLDVTRLRDSDLAATATGDEFRAAVLLWCASWHQVPAASLPDDDRVLAMLAGFGRDVEAWQAVRAGALSGFERASDGRLYHPVVVEKALIALASRVELSEKREAQRTRKQASRRVSAGRHADVTALNGDQTEQNGVGSAGDAAASEGRPSAASEGGPPAPVDDASLRARIYGPVAAWLAGNGGRGEGPVRTFLGRACRDHGDAATLEACIEAQARGAPDPLAYVQAILRGKRHERRGKRRDGAIAEDYRADMLAGVGLGAG